MKKWTVCGKTLVRGEKLSTILTVPMDGLEHMAILDPAIADYQIPATLICGAQPGKTLLVSTSIHAGEYIGIPAVIRTAKELDPQKLRGNVIFLHCVNLSGTMTHHYRELPEDHFNLNQNYPGDEKGTVGQRIAAWFVRELFPNVDFILDLHGGSPEEIMTPLVFYPHAHKVSAAALAAAKAMNIGYLVESYATTGEYSYAANFCGVPGMLMERGDGVICTEDKIADERRDIRLLLDHLDMYDAEPGMYDEQLNRWVVHKTIYLEADVRGLWYPRVERGALVKKGQLLGTVEDYFGEKIKEYRAVDDGVVLYYTQGLAVAVGDALVTYGLTAQME